MNDARAIILSTLLVCSCLCIINSKPVPAGGYIALTVIYAVWIDSQDKKKGKVP